MLSNQEVVWLNKNNINDIRHVEQFKHALTNDVFLLTTTKNASYIFKRLNRDARSDEDRESEFLVQQLANHYGLTTKVLAHSKDYKLQQYINGDLITNNKHGLSEFLAIQLFRIHQLPALHAPKQRLHQELQRLKKQLTVSIDADYFQKMNLLALQLDASSTCDTLCHGDLSLNNVLEGDDKLIHIIDWEYAVIATPAYDLAFCNCINHFSALQSVSLITSYHSKLSNPVSGSLQSLQKECDLYLIIFNYINELWSLCFVDKV